jgi:hypothetical protein
MSTEIYPPTPLRPTTCRPVEVVGPNIPWGCFHGATGPPHFCLSESGNCGSEGRDSRLRRAQNKSAPARTAPLNPHFSGMTKLYKTSVTLSTRGCVLIWFSWRLQVRRNIFGACDRPTARCVTFPTLTVSVAVPRVQRPSKRERAPYQQHQSHKDNLGSKPGHFALASATLCSNCSGAVSVYTTCRVTCRTSCSGWPNYGAFLGNRVAALWFEPHVFQLGFCDSGRPSPEHCHNEKWDTAATRRP